MMNHSRKAVIFDLDGTLFPTHILIVSAVKMALEQLGMPTIEDENIIRYIGQTSETFALSLLPHSEKYIQQEFADNLKRNERLLINQGVDCYPGLRMMLDELLGLGYNLGICSNGSFDYLQRVISSCGIRDCFSWISGAIPRSDKSTRLQALLSDNNIQYATFVGDRIDDIVAAQKCGIPIIGVNYGYGNDEIKSSTFIASEVSEIPSYVLQSEAFSNILTHIDSITCILPKIVGVNGIDTSGKTKFALRLADYLRKRGRKAFVIHVDDFHNPSEIRSRGENMVDAYLENAFNLELLEIEILKKVKQEKYLNKVITLLDISTDKYSLERHFNIDSDTIIILEGVFLYRPPIDKYIDTRVFLDIPFNEVIHRASIRDVPIYGMEILDRYRTKYLPAQKRYLEKYQPKEKSHIIIDNTDYLKPHVIQSIPYNNLEI